LHPQRAPEPGAGVASSGSEPLPSDFVSSSARRLAAAMHVTAAITGVYFLLYVFVWPEQARWLARVLSVVIVIASLVCARLVRQRPRSQSSVATIGVVYEVLFCLSVALMDFTHPLPSGRAMETVSWACVAIVFFQVIIPASPRRNLAGGLVAASMTPLALALAIPIEGHAVPAPDMVLSMVLPPYFCALLGVVPAGVMAKLGSELRRARRLGSYELVERLGSGGMGEVWRARHRMLARPAAIKLIKPEALGGRQVASDELLERFRREAQATASLESSHTVELYDFGVTDDGVLFHVMELLRGIDLNSLVRRFGPIPSERVVHILLQACDSLDDAHASGLIHRDVKPANIFLARRRRRFDHVKLLDFGLVKAVGRPRGEEEIEATREGRIPGTPGYMAPEMITGEGELDGQSDLYSLGCVAYWLLTGRLVFEEATAMKTAVAHVTQAPIPPSGRTEAPVLASLEALVMECLVKEPGARPAGAAALGERLAALRLPEPWTPERAEAWWLDHLPEAAAEEATPATPASHGPIPVRRG